MIYTFSGFRFDTDRHELYHGDRPLKLRPKVFDILCVLIERRERVVSKDELLETVWPGRYISETTLNSCIKELRKTLADTGRVKTVIKTVHGKGFRFIGTAAISTAVPADRAETRDAPEQDAATLQTPPPPAGAPPLTGVLPTCGLNGERKHVSVLRCGLVAADELAERLGAEAAHQLLQELFALAAPLVERFDGRVTQWLGDGFVALFGVPAALDDHARRALLAAFELAERCRALCSRQQVSLSFGLSSGELIVGAVPDNPRQFYTALSHTLHTARQLQLRAAPWQVLIDAPCYRHLRGDVRVLAEGDAWSVEQVVASQAGVPRRFRRHMAPLIGRDQERELLWQRLAQAEEGHGQAVAVVGSPGIGKSRLLCEFRRHLAGRGMRYVQANCHPHLQTRPYHLLSECLRWLCGLSRDDDDLTLRRKLGGALSAAGIIEADALALLLRLLDRAYDDTPLQALSGTARRDKTARYLSRLLLGDGRPTVIVLEDLHWTDASSADWLETLVRQLGDRPVLLLASYRPGAAPGWLQLPWVSRLALSRLTREHSLRLLCSLPRAAALQDRLLELSQLADGNPFFLEELALQTNQAVKDDGEGAVIPDTVQGVLSARIDQLDPADKTLLQTAAVIGPDGPLSLLATLSDEAEPAALEPALARLQCAELLFTVHRGHPSEGLSGTPSFVFKHALIQEVAYAHQLGDRRRELHRRIAAALGEELSAYASGRPEFLAHHHTEAEDYPQAVRCWQRAARHACERSAYQETLACAERGLSLLEHFDDPRARAEQELALLRISGGALMTLCGYGAARVERTWNRARALCERLGDDSALFRVLIGQSTYHLACGDLASAYDCNRRLLRLARRSGQPGLLLRASAAAGELLLHSGRLRLARPYLDRCLQLDAEAPQPQLSGQNAAIAASCYAAWLYWHLGEDARALAYGERALARARSLEQPFPLALALCLVADLHRFRDEPERALALAREGVDISREQGFPFWYGSNLVILGWAVARCGDPDEGVTAIRRALRIFRSTGARVQMPSWLGALADACRCAGRDDEARTAIGQARDWARRTRERYYLPQLETLLRRLDGDRTRAA